MQNRIIVFTEHSVYTPSPFIWVMYSSIKDSPTRIMKYEALHSIHITLKIKKLFCIFWLLLASDYVSSLKLIYSNDILLVSGVTDPVPPPLQTGGGGVRPRGPSHPPLTCVCTTYINFYILFSPPLSVRHYYLYFSNLSTLSLSNCPKGDLVNYHFWHLGAPFLLMFMWTKCIVN